VTNYKESAFFYSNLLGWKETYDEGSQHELLIGEVGDIIVRGGNPNGPNFVKGSTATVRKARLDHISFGISPWDTDRVKAELEKRGLRAVLPFSLRRTRLEVCHHRPCRDPCACGEKAPHDVAHG
jgi:hypothetical protein